MTDDDCDSALQCQPGTLEVGTEQCVYRNDMKAPPPNRHLMWSGDEAEFEDFYCLLFTYCLCLHVACKKGAGKGFVWSTGKTLNQTATDYCTLGKRQPLN